MAGRRQADTATEKAEPRTTIIRCELPCAYPATLVHGADCPAWLAQLRWAEQRRNTVAYSAGAVCCSDEASARRHQHRATWWDADASPEGGYVGPRWDPLTEMVVAHYRWSYGPRRRWSQ